MRINPYQISLGIPNVAYDVWVKVFDTSKGFLHFTSKYSFLDGKVSKVDIQTTLHRLVEVNADERAAIWEAPWNKDHPKYPQFLPFEDDVINYRLILIRPIVTKAEFESTRRELQKYLLIKSCP